MRESLTYCLLSVAWPQTCHLDTSPCETECPRQFQDRIQESLWKVLEAVRCIAPTDRPHVTAFTFASPRVGNDKFASDLEELGVKVLRIVNEPDLVPKVPGAQPMFAGSC
jgi:hypothetical protein